MSTYSFLFAWFETHPEGRKFAKEKFSENSDERHHVRMSTEVEQLGVEARACLQNAPSLCTTTTISTTHKSFMSQIDTQQMAKVLAAHYETEKDVWAKKTA